MAKEGYTHIAIVLDKSGSMSSSKAGTIEGFNGFLEAQKENDGIATLSLIQFGSPGLEVTTYDMVNISETEGLTSRSYHPNDGSTSLLDAIGMAINDTEDRIINMEEEDCPEKVIFVIITDGQENDSREFNRNQLMEMINANREENGWEFVFIGANQDAIQEGGSMGVRASYSYNYDATSIGTQDMYQTLTRGMTSYRNASVQDAADLDFFADEEEEEEIKGINTKTNSKDVDNLYRITLSDTDSN